MSTTVNEVPKKSVIFIPGKRLNLRLLEPTDADVCVHWFNDTEVTQYISRTAPLTRTAEVEYLEKMYKDDSHLNLGVETTEGKLIGTAGLHAIDKIDGTAVSGTVIGDKSYWGRRYGTEAKMLLLDYAFNTLNLRMVQSYVFSFNERSLACTKGCGYREVGRLVNYHFARGKYCDEVILLLNREDFLPIWEKFKKDNL